MRIVVFSDSHNEFFAIKRILDLNQGRADLFLHLGDGNREFEDIRDLYPGCRTVGKGLWTSGGRTGRKRSRE